MSTDSILYSLCSVLPGLAPTLGEGFACSAVMGLDCRIGHNICTIVQSCTQLYNIHSKYSV